MGGGLMQLVAYGAQDIYLTGNPQITFFKVVYRRHTNFSMESILQTFNGQAKYGGTSSATISRNGDLVYRMYLEHNASLKSTASTNTLGVGEDYGSHLMKQYELEIGGQRIDKHYGHWHSVYSRLNEMNPSGQDKTFFDRLSGNGKPFQALGSVTPPPPTSWTIDSIGGTNTAKGRFFIPLYFWFCRNPGLALPLIALQYHEVKVKITFEDIGNLVANDADNATFGSTATTAAAVATVANRNESETSFELWVDYIYLDTDERRRFAQVSHEYLIEQLQYEDKAGGGAMDLNFNHPVKELIWATKRDTTPNVSIASLYVKPSITAAHTFKLKLNGHDRFKERSTKYFTKTQVWQHHTGYGGITDDSIAVYSFALKPEEHQPSGTCNFSRIDNAQLVQEGTTPQDLSIYAVNYNVLRIMSGMGGLAYSN